MMQSLHGTCKTIRSERELEHAGIKRNNCLNNKLRYEIIDNINAHKDLLFLGNDVSEPIKKCDYHLSIHGILPCGTKTTVIINGIQPYVDIMINPGETEADARTRIGSYTMSTYEDVDILRMETISGKDFMFYKHEKSQFIRAFFKSLAMLTAFVNYCKNSNIKTYSNATSAYYRVVARNHEINLSGWNVIKNYKIISKNQTTSKAEYVFSMDVNDIVGIQTDEDLYRIASEHGYNQSIVRYENMILASFDIEMIPHDSCRLPDAEKCPKDEIFMIAITFHFVKRPESILNIVLTLKKSTPLDDAFIIHCQSEACLISAFAKCMALMQPDFITEFNGGGFDWKNVVEKARLHNVLKSFLEDMSLVKLQLWETRPSYQTYFINGRNVKLLTIGRAYGLHKIKINGATAEAIVRNLKMTGYISFDTYVIFRQLEPNADSHKLNECLRRCNLGSKDDLDVNRLFEIYRNGKPDEMAIAAHYCFIDTYKLQQLLIKKNVVQDHREIANLSYTSISDTFMFAGGSRMRNLLMNRAEKLGYVFDIYYKPTVEDKNAKFPGAYVVPPIKGIVKPLLRLDEFANKCDDIDTKCIPDGYKYIEQNFDRIYHSSEQIKNAPDFIKPYIEYTNTNENQYPISGLDYSSLYPSIIMTYNISPEKLIVDEEYANKVKEMGETLQYVTFPFCGKMVKAWFVRHNNVKSNYSVCGSLLIELFNRRAALKKVLKRLNEKIFELEQEMKPYIASNTIDKFPRIDEYNETKFDQVSCDSKQRAVKIFMNTLYGAMGETNSFICAIEVAASVTTMGRYNLLLARKFVEDKMKMKVYYGDTDSLYVSCNKQYFMDHDREYFIGKIDKIEYGSRLVKETFKQIEVAKVNVNKHLMADNGSKHLSMAYEEVLYPVAFLSKKKYYGVPHEENVDFYPKNLFLRGLEIVKRGSSDVLKDIVNSIIREVMDIKSTDDILDIIKIAIQRFFTTKWPVEVFAKSKVYRVDKNNISVNTMIKRYRDLNYPKIPEQNVRFKTVMCKYYPWQYKIDGTCRSTLKVGDRMELVDRVIEENLEIDLDYYFENELTGQLARLISFCDIFDDVVKKFQNNDVDLESMSVVERNAYEKESYKKVEDALFNAAKKYIDSMAKEYSNSFTNKNSLFVDTWRTVTNTIKLKPYLLPYNQTQLLAMSMFVSHDVNNIENDLLTWSEKHIMVRYKMELDQSQRDKLFQLMAKIKTYMHEHDIANDIINGVQIWKERVIRYMYDKYDYKGICDRNLPVKHLSDIMTLPSDLENIMKCDELKPKFNIDHARWIIDTVIMNMACVIKL